MTDYEIDPIIWFGQRQVSFLPKHFILTNAPLTEVSKQWILDNVKGRYCFVQSDEFFLFDSLGNVAFEDAKDATFYELKWS